MQTLKKMISKYMRVLSFGVVVIGLLSIMVMQMLNEQHQARESANRIFRQMEQVLEENQKELEVLEADYSRTCLHNAEAIAYIIEDNPKVLESVDELRKIAEFVEVDEIHIFDTTGRIFTGTHPEYYDLTFASGEQIGFFEPLLEDKSLKLVQPIVPNTAEEKLMQYSALWSENGEFIVQIGMEPVSVMKVTEKNELSHVFALLRANADANYYAIDANSGEIVGSTVLEDVGKSLSEAGIDAEKMKNDRDGFHARVNGEICFCIFKQVGTNYIGRVLSTDWMYRSIPANTLFIAVCLIIIAHIFAYAVTGYMNRYVVGGIQKVNEKLRIITKGELEEYVDVQTSVEFAELSNHINEMVKSILDNNRKMSYILSKTNMYVGVYEYNEQSRKVRFTEYVPKILMLNEEQTEELTADYLRLREFLAKLQQNPVPGESGVFELSGECLSYVRIEEIVENNQVFGVVIDVTKEINKLKMIEVERDIDTLTGLYNRRGLENRLAELFRKPEELGYSAFIMIDADGLKGINDKYGHEKGDIYLKKIAGVINNFGIKSSLASRQGGDEFVLFLYEYDDGNELLNTIKTLQYIQDHSTAKLGEDISVPLSFSLGFSMVDSHTDYQQLLKDADEKMYENKRQRKQRASSDLSGCGD